MSCWYCGDKDGSHTVAGKDACPLCYRDYNHGEDRDNEVIEPEEDEE